MQQTIVLAGNPNAGKTSLFNMLTGSRQYVGNWAGVTVEKKEGWIKGLDGGRLIDLPGIYSLSAQSLEEQIAVGFLLEERTDVTLNILDASNLERNLYFSVQLLEMGLPSVAALNMMDVAKAHGLGIDTELLAQKLTVPVVPMVARKGKGQQQLLQTLKNGVPKSSLVIPYGEAIENALLQLQDLLEQSALHFAPSKRWIALTWLEGNERMEKTLHAHLPATILEAMKRIREQAGADIDQLIRNTRYAWIEAVLAKTTYTEKTVHLTWSDRIDSLILHRYLGIPIFLLVMFLLFQLTFSWIGTGLSDRLDAFFSGPLTNWLQAALVQMNSPAWFSHLMTDGILSGVGAVLVFVPQIGILFLCLSFLEDSGYMARAAVLMDRFMQAIGLNGKAFIPLILGFGCNVPAIMATRTLEDRKGRLLTALISPFMSCSARLSVYSLFVGAFFSHGQGLIVFLLYLTGIVMAILSAFLLRRFIKAEEGIFLLEIPPYRTPMMKNLLLHTWDKAKGFVRKAGTIIFGMSVLLWFLGHFGWHGMVPMDQSFLAAIGGVIGTLFAPMGFDSWQAGLSLLTGFLAKEVVVSTMSIAYGAGNDGMLGHLLQGAFSSASALSFLFFVLLYTPCLSTVAMMKRETGSWRWTITSIVYSLALAWVVAFVVYWIALWIF